MIDVGTVAGRAPAGVVDGSDLRWVPLAPGCDEQRAFAGPEGSRRPDGDHLEVTIAANPADPIEDHLPGRGRNLTPHLPHLLPPRGSAWVVVSLGRAIQPAH